MTEPYSTRRPATRKYVTLLTGFAIVSVALLLLSRRYLSDFNDYYFPAYVVFAAAFGVFLLRLRLKDLYRGGKLHGILLAIAEKGLAAALVQRYLNRSRSRHGILLRLSVLALFIFLLIVVLAANDILFEENLSILEMFDWIGHSDPAVPVPIRRLMVQTDGRGTEERLQLMLKVTEDLSRTGAKVIVLDLPYVVAHPYYRNLVSRIQSSGNVVFSVDNDYYLKQPITWQTRQLYGPMTAPDSAVRNWGLVTAEYGRWPRMRRSIFFVPDGYVHKRQPGVDTIPDVTIEILRKWRDYPADLKPVHSGREVVFGDYRIPVSTNGLGIALDRFNPGMGFLKPAAVDPAMNFLKPMAVDYWKGGGFSYWWDTYGEERTAADLHEFENEIRGTIVLVSWFDPVEKNSNGYRTDKYPTVVALMDELLDRFVTVRDDMHVPATIIVLIVALLLTARVRPLVSIPLLATLGALMVYGAGWLFWEKRVIFEVLYPVAGIALSILLLPLAKISAEIEKEEP